MEDRTAARALVARYHRDRDEQLAKLIGRVLQALHDDQRPRHYELEIQLMNEQVDCYENLGWWDYAAAIKLARVVVMHERDLANGGPTISMLAEAA